MTVKSKKYGVINTNGLKDMLKPIYDLVESYLEDSPLIEVEYLAKGVRKVKGSNHILANFSLKDANLFNITKKDNYIYCIYDLSLKNPKLKYIGQTNHAGTTLKKTFLLNDDVYLDEKQDNPSSQIYNVYNVIKKKTGKIGFRLLRLDDASLSNFIYDFIYAKYNLADETIGWK